MTLGESCGACGYAEVLLLWISGALTHNRRKGYRFCDRNSSECWNRKYLLERLEHQMAYDEQVLERAQNAFESRSEEAEPKSGQQKAPETSEACGAASAGKKQANVDTGNPGVSMSEEEPKGLQVATESEKELEFKASDAASGEEGK